ncbi:MAG: hypothetical protein ACO3NW_09580 [Kiritimatiellia bacterium]
MSRTVLDIQQSDFLLNGTPTMQGRIWNGHRMEGLLPNCRMVQGIFNDLNPLTRDRWDYPDGPWDADRNTDAFVAAMPEWRAHGLLGFTLNLQGGSPEGYSREQPWINSAFAPDGSLRSDYFCRLARIPEQADRLGMAVILGLFYFGQEPRMESDAAIRRAAAGAVDWLLGRRDRHVLIEVANETDLPHYRSGLFQDTGAADMIRSLQEYSRGRVDNRAGRLYVGTSFSGGTLPGPGVTEVSDLLLIHGNGVNTPAGLTDLIRNTRALPAFRGQPVVVNEDDHTQFEHADNHFIAATREHAS